MGDRQYQLDEWPEERSPRRWLVRPPDRRSRGTMAQFVRELLSLSPRGWTRPEVRSALGSQHRFASLQQDSRASGRVIWQLKQRGEIEERDGELFATERTRLSVVVRKELFELDRDGLAGTRRKSKRSGSKLSTATSDHG